MEDTYLSIIGMITARRKQLHLTHPELAKKAGTTQTHITRIETLRSMPKIDMLFKIAYALDLRMKITKENENGQKVV